MPDRPSGVPAHPDDLLPHVEALRPGHGGVRRGESLLIAFSGGPDSLALLDLLERLRERLDLRLIAAHLDHGLRPEAGADLAFCREICHARGIPLRVHREDVARLARERRVGIEAAGREARYRWLEELRRAEGLERIATGHHLDDHVETLLLWLFRGTGLRGLRGIPARRGVVVRPLREFDRARIERYLRWRGLEAREDVSNRDGRHLRNRIRQELLPVIVDLFGEGAPRRLAAFARRGGRDLRLLMTLGEQHLEQSRRPSADGSLELDREAFLDQPAVLRLYALRAALDRLDERTGPQRVDEAGLRRLLRFAREARAGKRTPLPGGGWLVAERDRLRLLGDPPGAVAGTESPEMGYRLVEELLPAPVPMVRFSQERTALFDADRLRPPLRLRRVRPGDRMRPRGMAGHKKLSDLYRERGVPRERRGSMLVVEDAERIVWAVDVATEEQTRARADSARVLKLTLSAAEEAKEETRPEGSEPTDSRTVPVRPPQGEPSPTGDLWKGSSHS